MRSCPALLLLFALLTVSLPAQCGRQWLPGDSYAGANGSVEAVTGWDPDGPGPAGEQLVVAGWFHVVASTRADYIARFDPTTGQWSSFGTGMNAPVYALLPLPNGDLIAAGAFSTAGGVPVANIARWNGTGWAPIGAGLPTTSGQFGVLSLAMLPNGDLVAGGNFWLNNGAMSVARWDGSSWSPLGGGITGSSNSTVFSLLVRGNGDLVAGGEFGTVGGVAVANIARWDGVAWSALGLGVDARVQALSEGPGGVLVAGGIFDNAGGAPAARIAAWDGANWSPLGAGMPGQPFGAGVFSLTRLGSNLIAGGNFNQAGSTAADHVAMWDGSTWSGLGNISSTNSALRAMTTLASGDVVVGGGFTSAGGVPARNLARLDGLGWHAFGSGIDGYLQVAVPLPNGDLLVGGRFTQIGGVAANNVARRVGGVWQPLGSGTDQLVTAVAVLPNGDVVAGGQFTSAGGAPANRIARWDGASWQPLGAGVSGGFQPEVWALHVATNGDLLVGGTFTNAGGVAANRIARWNAAGWSALGLGVANGASTEVKVGAIATRPNGDIVVAGDFATAGGVAASRIASWNGTAWAPLGAGVSLPFGAFGANVRSLLVTENGDVVAAGGLAGISGTNNLVMQRWNGTTWTSLTAGLAAGSSPFVMGLAELPNGDLAAGVTRVGVGGGAPSNSLVRWDGSTWSLLDTDFDGAITTLVLQPDGTLEVGGAFAAIGSTVTAGLARLVTTCPPVLVPLGAGCAGSGGPNVLAATSPWLGGTFRSTVTGLAPGALTVAVYGFQPLALPMPSVHPAGLPGCTLWVDDDVLLEFVPGNGSVACSLAIPDQPALVGGVFHHQVVAVEVGSGGITALTSSNAVTATVGVF